MKTGHLTEIEIQQYSFDPAHCESSIVDHIEHCGSCKAKAGVYQSISSEIKNMGSPVFNFNLAGLVLSQLPQPKPKPYYSISFFHLLAVGLLALLCISLFLLQPYITKLFTIAPFLYYLVALPAIIITVLQGIEMYRGFQNKMNRLNLY